MTIKEITQYVKVYESRQTAKWFNAYSYKVPYISWVKDEDGT